MLRPGGGSLDSREAARQARRRLALAWVAVALCVAAILGLGSAEFGAAQTSRYLLPMLRWLFPDLSLRTYLTLIVWIRKTAHVTEYALLGVLAFRAVWLSLTRQGAPARAALLALALAAGVATTDETRQAFLASRTGSPWDVALDVSGALAAIAFSIAWWRRRRPGAAAEAEPA